METLSRVSSSQFHQISAARLSAAGASDAALHSVSSKHGTAANSPTGISATHSVNKPGAVPSVGHADKSESLDKERQAVEARLEKKQQQVIQAEVRELSMRDREVRAHEQAHVAAGGQYAGGAEYSFKRGPDGVNYAVAGEVSISTGREATPEATLRKAQIVRRAALAPAEPSPQDRQVASIASRMEAEARAEIAQRSAEAEGESVPAEDEETSAEDHSETKASKGSPAHENHNPLFSKSNQQASYYRSVGQLNSGNHGNLLDALA